MRQTRFLLLLLILLAAVPNSALLAQVQDAPSDTTSLGRRNPKAYRAWDFVAGADVRNSFIYNDGVYLLHVRLGAEYKRVRFGLGAQFSYLPRTYALPTNGDTNLRGARRETLIRMGTVWTEYVFFRHKRWTLTAWGNVGFGAVEFTDKLANGAVNYLGYKSWIVSFEPMLGGNFQIVSWLGIGIGVGYRKFLAQDSRVAELCDGPFYYGRVNLSLPKFKK